MVAILPEIHTEIHKPSATLSVTEKFTAGHQENIPSGRLFADFRSLLI
jgi:hypothetical protein